MKSVVLFNGPPGCGKDDAAEHLFLQNPRICSKMSFKDRLFQVTAVIYGVSETDLRYTWYTRELKEVPRKELRGLSPREALINVSENIIKPNFSKRYFGEALANSLSLSTTRLNLISDSGFPDELLPIIEEIGSDNILVVRIFGRGSYENDSRNYLTEEFLRGQGVEYVDIDNTGTLKEYLESVSVSVDSWLEVKHEKEISKHLQKSIEDLRSD